MMTILLELSFLAASVALLSLCFATHNVHRAYLLALYGLATAFFSCSVLSMFDSLHLTVGATLLALAVAVVAGIITYLRSKEWGVEARSAFMVRFAIVIPLVLFFLVVTLRILLHLERKRNRADPPATACLITEIRKKIPYSYQAYS